jgi:hypothetical protein
MFNFRCIARPLAIAAVCSCTSLVFSAAASAASITVNVRVEGSATTLFEGPVTTHPETIEAPSSRGPHPCDYSENGLGNTEANGGSQAATPTTALHEATRLAGLAFDAEWFGSGTEKLGNPGDFFITQIGADKNQTSAPFDSWGYAVNHTTANVGGCQIALAPGNEVLWAYNYFNLVHLLNLSGPSVIQVGVPVTLHVTDGRTGEPISGAAIGEDIGGITAMPPGGPLTNANGEAAIVLTHTGSVTIKATRSDSVRSNGLVVCVHAANDGSCGTAAAQTPGGASTTTSNGQRNGQPPLGPDIAEIVGMRSGHVYSRRAAPRVLRGLVKVPVGDTLRQTRIRLERRHDGHCFNFSGSRESFVRTSKCGTASFFSVGATESFSYLLPTRLPVGRYVYDVDAVENTGKTTKLVSGVSHIVFRVK